MAPVLNAQLRAFQRFLDRLTGDARAIAGATGAFVNDDPAYLQPTGFVLDPAGRVVVSVYSSGAIGRLVPDDVIGLVHLRDHLALLTVALVLMAARSGRDRGELTALRPGTP